MPNKEALLSFTGGLNEKVRPDLLEDQQLQVCTNYEIKGDGVLHKRKGTEEYDPTLNAAIATVFSAVSFISEPWYPKTPLKKGTVVVGEHADDSDFMLFVFGETKAGDGSPSGNYELHIFFTINGTWTNILVDSGLETLTTYLTAANITYSSDIGDIGSDIEMAFATDSVFIADGVNNSYSVSIDIDGTLSAGIAGIPAPTNKARVTQLTSFNAAQWEADPDASRLGTPGLFQCIYTVVTKTGEESNPSALSDTLDLQFFQLDEDGVDERWLEKVDLADLSVPDVSSGMLDTLKWFKIYMRIIKYSAGEDVKSLEFTEQFRIIDKSSTSGTTGNTVTVTVEPTSGETASYENDLAPVAKTIDFLGGITMLGNVKTKIQFPWDFKYYHTITIRSRDTKSYVDAVIRIRLSESDIDNFVITDFFDADGDDQSSNSHRIRIFDSDLTTPIMIVSNGFNDDDFISIADGFVDFFIKIPLLVSGGDHIIYLCWTPHGDSDAADFPGVPDEYNKLFGNWGGLELWEQNVGTHYGRIFSVFSSWWRQQVFTGERSASQHSLLCSPMNFLYQNSIQNKSNFHYHGYLNTSTGIEGGYSQIPLLDIHGAAAIPAKKFVFDNSESGKVTFGNLGQGEATESVESALQGKKVSFWGRLSYAPNSNDFTQNRILIEWDADHPPTVELNIKSIADQLRWRCLISGSSFQFNNIFPPKETASGDEKVDYFLLFSINDVGGEAELSLFIMNLAFQDMTQSYCFDYERIDIGSYNNLKTFNNFKMGEDNGESNDYSLADAEWSQIQMETNRYYNAENIDDIDAVKNKINFMPAFDEMIGYKYSDTSHNNNITFDETKENILKPRRNMVKWTDVNYSSFPDLFFKQVKEPILKVVAAPSFLQFEYQNTFILFTRNSINRFILEGSADGWGGSAASLIEEKKQYGLLAVKSLTRAGDALFWLSEVGVVMWNKEGLVLISKNVVDVPIKDTCIGFYNSINNQYILHDNNSSPTVSYVYHIERNAWVKFTGLDIVKAGVVSGGDDLDNVNLILDSTGAINTYPSTGVTTETTEIKTKDIFFEKGVLQRMKVDYETLPIDTDLSLYVEPLGGATSLFLTGGTTDSAGLEVGDVIKLQDEEMFINEIITNTNIIVTRGHNGTTITNQPGGTAIYKIEMDISSNITTLLASGSEKTNTNTISAPNPNQWRGIALQNSRGSTVSFGITGADTIKKLVYDLRREV